jgi:hypothetical protein
MYTFQRTTGDDPFRRDPSHGTASAVLVRDRGDAERGLERIIAPPAPREWAFDGWVTTVPDAPDASIDALVGVKGTFNSSGRFQGRPGSRASSAFDGTPRPWIGSWQDGRHAWLEWEHAATIRDLTLDPVPGVRRPTQVRLRSERATSETLTMAPDGAVHLPQPLRGTRFRLEILRAAFAAGTPGSDRRRAAVGIAEVRGAGIPTVQMSRAGTLPTACEAITVAVGSRRVGLSLDATTADLDAGRPLRVGGCKRLALPAGETRLVARPGVFTPYLLRMRSGASGAAPASPGTVVSAGTATRGGRENVKLALNGPARLVLAESYNRGRRATCDGKDLGTPEVGGLYGTAWQVPRSCTNVTITFAPNRLVNAGYALSQLVGLLLLVLVLVRRPKPRPPQPEPLEAPAARALPASKAALIAVPLALAFGFAFAARGTPLFAIGIFFILWRGIGARELALAGGAVLVIAVPILTALIRPDNRGGYNPEYSIDGVAVHWVTVAGVSLLILALSRAMVRPGRARSAPPSAAARPAPAP